MRYPRMSQINFWTELSTETPYEQEEAFICYVPPTPLYASQASSPFIFLASLQVGFVMTIWLKKLMLSKVY